MHCYDSEAPSRGKASNNPLQGLSKPPVEPAVLILKNAGLAAQTVVWCLAWKGVKTVNTLENLYYGNIDPHEHTVSNGTDKGELLETVVRLETEHRATLTEQQKALLEQFEKADAEISDRHELQAFTIGFRLAARLMMEVYEPTPELEP